MKQRWQGKGREEEGRGERKKRGGREGRAGKGPPEPHREPRGEQLRGLLAGPGGTEPKARKGA